MAQADPLTLLARAVDQAGKVISGVREDQAGLPTPCASWDVRTLIEHMINDLGQFTVAATGGRPDFGTPSPAVSGDWARAFREHAPGLLAVWRQAGDMNATVHLPIGDLPASFVVNQQIAEFAVHSWDLALATGQDVDLDPEVAGHALEWGATALLPKFRGAEEAGYAFGPEVPVANQAPVADRLAGFFGRDPAIYD
jgi:uncharacterized protein (TIGR03086 family)